MNQALSGALTMHTIVVMGLGVASLLLIGCGVRRTIRTWRQPRALADWSLFYLYAFRRIVVGLCCLGVAVGLDSGTDWLAAASTCVGIGELIESSYYINLLTWRRSAGRPRPCV
jgi:hypothetical protein